MSNKLQAYLISAVVGVVLAGAEIGMMSLQTTRVVEMTDPLFACGVPGEPSCVTPAQAIVALSLPDQE